jgi:uncharacterized membrane protein
VLRTTVVISALLEVVVAVPLPSIVALVVWVVAVVTNAVIATVAELLVGRISHSRW